MRGDEMRKMIGLLSVCFLVLATAMVLSALDTKADGKNLLNPAYFQGDAGENVFYTNPRHPVTSGVYTLSVPAGLGSVLLVESGGEILVNESDSASLMCDSEDSDVMVCRLELTESDFYMEMRGGAAYQHFGHFGLDGFQLEKGEEATPYEPYQPKDDVAPVFSGSGFIVLSYTETQTLEELVDAHVGAYDEIDGDLSDEIVIAEDGYSEHSTTTGEYEATLEVSDSSGNTAYFTLVVIVKDEIPPVITGPDTLHVDVDKPPLLEDLIDEHFLFYDDYDGALDGYVVYDDSYSDALGVLGEKSVTIGVVDASGNETFKTFSVIVEDVTPPSIVGPSAVEILLSEPMSFEEVLLLYALADNHTPEEDIALYIHEENLSENLDTPGEYYLTLQAVDASGNETLKIVHVDILDDVAPELNGPVNHRISYTVEFDWVQLRNQLFVYDNVDDLTVDDVAMREHNVVEGEIGSYTVVFEVSDAAGNLAFHSVVVDVIDDVPPVFVVDDRIIVTEGSSLSEGELLSIASQSATAKTFEAVSFEILHDDYSAFKDTPGLYSYEVEMTNESGEKLVHAFDVVVEEPQAERGVAAVLWIALCGLGLIGASYVVLKRRE